MPERRLVDIITEKLRVEITTGGYVDALPSNEELGRKFGVSRLTARSAINQLQAEGLVRSHQGKGTFVNTVTQAEILLKNEKKGFGDLPGTFGDALWRYFQFLANPKIARGTKVRTIQIFHAQLSLVEDLQAEKENLEPRALGDNEVE